MGRFTALLFAGAVAASCAASGAFSAAPEEHSASAAGVSAVAAAPTLVPSTPSPAPTATPQPTTEPTKEPTPVPTLPPRWLVPPVAVDQPEALAKQLIEAEQGIRDPKVSGPELAWFGQLQQLVYRKLAIHPEWRQTVSALMPADIREAVLMNIDADTRLLDMSRPATRMPAWRIVEPASADDLLIYYRAAEAEFGVPWQYLAAIHLIETRMGRIRGLSTAGAQGPMQFMPATWAAYGDGDVNDNKDAIRAAARYLRATGAPGNMPRAIWWYNHADEYVQAVIDYAKVMIADPPAYRGYHGWQVYYYTRSGDVLLPVGWPN